MMGKYRSMNKTNPIKLGVVIPALFKISCSLVLKDSVGTDLAGRVLRIRKNDGKIELRMITKASPP